MIKGCQIGFPDTAFFSKDGRVDCYICNDKDGCLTYFLDDKKMNPFAIKNKIYYNSREKDKNRDQFWFLFDLYKRLRKDIPKSYYAAKNEPISEGDRNEKDKNEIVLLRYRKKAELKQDFSTTFGSNEFSSVEEKSEERTDRERHIKASMQEGQMTATYLLNNKTWSSVLSSAGENAPIYKEIEYLQTRVRAGKDKGVQFDIHFIAPLNDHDAESAKNEIFYDYKSMPDDLELLMQEKYLEYCRK